MLGLQTTFALFIAAAATVVNSAPAKGNSLSHVKRADPEDVVALFKRQDRTYPPAGSIPDRSTIPQAWLDKLATVTLPNIPVASGTGRPTYPGRQVTDPEICSFTYECDSPEDLKEPAAGRLAFTFDDGPSGGTDALWSFLESSNIRGGVTHFMIGSYIAGNPSRYQSIATGGAHIGVHTWSHMFMTTLTNEQVVAELGWCMQIQADYNNGRVPRYWRPPYGDVDNRVRAIAKGVFGLQTVTWNQDTGDWNLDQGGSYTVQSITDTFNGWLGDKSKGLNVLEHEVRPSQIEVFRNIYPRAQQQGWMTGNVAQVWNLPWYQNARDGNSTVVSMAIGASAAVSGGGASASRSASVSVSASASASSVSASASSSASAPASSSIVSASRSSSGSASASVSSAGAGTSASPRPSSAGFASVMVYTPGVLSAIVAAAMAMVL